jgi:hypothetical protein
MKETAYVLDRPIKKTFSFKNTRFYRKVKFWILAPYYYIQFERWVCNLKKKDLKKQMFLLKCLGRRNPFIRGFAADRIAKIIRDPILKIINEAPDFKTFFAKSKI